MTLYPVLMVLSGLVVCLVAEWTCALYVQVAWKKLYHRHGAESQGERVTSSRY